MGFDVPISVTHKIDNSVLRNKWPEDLSIYTLRFFPKQSGNTLPALSFLAPRGTGDSICEHMHDTEELIGYLQNKHESAHVCPQCEIEGRIGNQNGGKKPKVEIETWERPPNKTLGLPNPRRFTTEVYDPKSDVLDNEDIETLAKFCGRLAELAVPLFKNRNEKEDHWLILAKDITKRRKATVGFAFFTEKLVKETIILGGLNKKGLEQIFKEKKWRKPNLPSNPKVGEERWEQAASFIVDYMNERKKQFDTKDDDYQEEFDDLIQDIHYNFIYVDDPMYKTLYDQLKPITQWMLTYKPIVLEKKAVTKALIYVNLICADPKYYFMGVSKGVFRRLQKRVIELAETKPVDTIAVIELQPAEEHKGLYKSYGFVPIDKDDPPTNLDWTSGDLITKPLAIDNIVIRDPNKNIIDPNIN